MKIKLVHPLQWIFDELSDDESFQQKRMFGCLAAYINGRLCVVIADGEEPWNGLLICTSQIHHVSLKKDFPKLTNHRVLGKWLYMSQTEDDFESLTRELMSLVLKRDERIGVESKPKKKKKRVT